MTVTAQDVVDKLNKELFALDFITIDACETAWNEQTITNVTSTLDTTDYIKGSGSAKFTIAAGFTTGNIASEALTTSIDLRTSDKIKLRLKSNIALLEDDLNLILSDSPQLRSPLKTLTIPAMDPAIWYQHTIDLIDPDEPVDLVDICSIGLKSTRDFGAAVINIDDVRGYNSEYAVSTVEVDKAITSATIDIATYLGLVDLDDIPTTGDSITFLEEALSYWAAGLLWNRQIAQKNQPADTYLQGRTLKDVKTEGDNLISTAKNILKLYA